MFLEILVAMFLGVIAGIFTGLIPGVHVNLISLLVVSLSVKLLFFGIDSFVLVVFIISLALTHSFLDSIPGIYLGAPDASQVASIMPAHQLFLAGKGHLAYLYSVIGSLFSLLLTIAVFPYGFLYLKQFYTVIEPYIVYVLLILLIVLFVKSKRMMNILFFLFAGLLGLLVFNIPSQDQVLLPLLSGLFGVSTLLISLQGKSVNTTQYLNKNKIDVQLPDIEHAVGRGTVFGIFAAFFPGFGSSQSAILALSTMKQPQQSHYLLLVGAINTVNFAFSLVTVYVLSKARNGAIVALQDLMELQMQHVWYIVAVLLVVGGLATLIGIRLSKVCARLISKVNYELIVIVVIIILVVLTIVLSGVIGLVILVSATALSLLAQKYAVQKNMLLGCLLLPVILYLL